MSVQIHEELADALLEVIEGLDIKGYKWAPGGIKPPCAVIEMPTLRRTEPDQAEDHIGATDWRLDFPVLFYIELGTKVADSQATLTALAFDFVKAIDNLTPTGSAGLILNELCTDAKVVSAEPFAPLQGEKESRVQLGYETHVSILTFQ